MVGGGCGRRADEGIVFVVVVVRAEKVIGVGGGDGDSWISGGWWDGNGQWGRVLSWKNGS